ncbi:hypothetical protein [Emticicia sp. 17c]|uniref:hypothetical protein n=1 Tax=Emticicia sp. 17c TaxID=3127704 RepID=UPI00301E34AE
MERTRSDYLMDRLINSKLSKEELEELLAGIGENEMSPEYSAFLEEYFNQLLLENSITKNTGTD